MKAILRLLCVLICGSTLPLAQSVKGQGQFQNVVFILGDDHRTEAIGAYGNRIVKTPNLDRMAARGTRFTKAFANSPVCSASRQSLLTGKYPHATGVSLLTSPLPEKQVTLADHLLNFGFKTAIIGKNHFNNDLNHGFDLKIERRNYLAHLASNPPAPLPTSVKTRPTWRPFKDPADVWLNAEGLPSALRDEDEAGTFYAKKAIDFVNQNKNNRFCLFLGLEEPHSPFNFPVEFAGRHKAQDMTLPTGSKEDDMWVPEIFKGLTDDQKKGIIASYYTSVEYLDKNVGLLLDALDAAGLTESTMVIYLGDHGYLLNDHKRFEKHMMWEKAVNAPLIIQAGGKFGKDKVENALTEFVDLVPTAIAALGVDPLDGIHGKSLIPLLAGKQRKLRDFVFSEYLVDNTAMIRTEKWKYIYTTGRADLGLGYATGNPPTGVLHLLYKVDADPNETKNVANVPENRNILTAMQDTLLRVFMKTHPISGTLPASWTKDQKLAAYCEPPELGAK
jgi:choline-sulfatase